jgi:hypothetical protein
LHKFFLAFTKRQKEEIYTDMKKCTQTCFAGLRVFQVCHNLPPNPIRPQLALPSSAQARILKDARRPPQRRNNF